MKNWLSLLGLLGFLGLLGPFTGNPGFYGFFGFFGYFGFANVIPDEMFKLNVNKAAKNAFLAGMVIYPIVVLAGAVSSYSLAFGLGFAINFAVQNLIFGISLVIYEKSGDVR